MPSAFLWAASDISRVYIDYTYYQPAKGCTRVTGGPLVGYGLLPYLVFAAGDLYKSRLWWRLTI